MQLPSNFRTLNQLRQFDPARSWLWDLNFGFRPFNNAYNSSVSSVNLSNYIPTKVVSWIPADSLNRVLSIVESSDLQAGQNNFRFASGTSSKDITINFIDDYRQSIKDWLEAWMEYVILCNGNGINYINNYYDILTIQDLLPNGDVRKTYKIHVYPDGTLSESNTSDSSVKVYSQNFVVCGKAD